jgi:hypothetical protein
MPNIMNTPKSPNAKTSSDTSDIFSLTNLMVVMLEKEAELL